MLNKLGVCFPTEPFVIYFLVLLLLAGVTLVATPCTAQQDKPKPDPDIEYIRVYSIRGEIINYDDAGMVTSPPYDFNVKTGDQIIFEFKAKKLKLKDEIERDGVFYFPRGHDRERYHKFYLHIGDMEREAEHSDANGGRSASGNGQGLTNAKNKLYFRYMVVDDDDDGEAVQLGIRDQISDSTFYESQRSPFYVTLRDREVIKYSGEEDDTKNARTAVITYETQLAENARPIIDHTRPQIDSDFENEGFTSMPPMMGSSHVFAVWKASKMPSNTYMANNVVKAGTPPSETVQFYKATNTIQGQLKFTEAMKLNIPNDQIWIVLSGTKTPEATAALNAPTQGMEDPDNDLRILTFSYIVPDPMASPAGPATFALNPVFLAGRVSSTDSGWDGITDRAGNNLLKGDSEVWYPIPGESGQGVADPKVAPLSISSGSEGQHAVDNIRATTTIVLPDEAPTGEFSVTISFQNVFGDPDSDKDKFAEFHSDSDTAAFITKFEDNNNNEFVENGEVVPDSVMYTGVQMSPSRNTDNKFFPYYTLYTARINPQAPLVTIKVPVGTVSDIAGNGNKALEAVTVMAGFTQTFTEPPEISRVASPSFSGNNNNNIDVEVTFDFQNALYHGENKPYVTLYLGPKLDEKHAEWQEVAQAQESDDSTKVTFRYTVQAGDDTSKVILGNSVTLPKDSIIYSATGKSIADYRHYKATGGPIEIPFFSGDAFEDLPEISRPAFPEDAPDSYNEGQNIEVEATFDIDNARYHGEAPYVPLYLGSRDEENRQKATWVPNSEVDVESTKVTFRYTVGEDDDTSEVIIGDSLILPKDAIIYSAPEDSDYRNYRYYAVTGEPIEISFPSGVREANPSAVAMDRVIFNELRNAREDKNDWLELKNISDTAISLKAWQISLVTGQSDAAVVAFPDYTLPPGGILLIVNTDPGATDLARGQNIASAASKGGGVATQYFVASSLKLPSTPYLLLLRSASDKTGKPEAFEDVLGTYFRASLEYATQVWPLRETTQPENAAVLTPDEAWQRKFEADKVTARGYAAAAWRASGYQAGLGYDAKASERSSLGTPGYPNAALVSQSGAGQISISELMFSSQGGPHSLPQWIELYNNSSTDAVNLAGWKLEVALRTAEGAPRTGGFTFETLHVLPNQTVLLVTYNGRHSGHFPDARVYNLATRHGAELQLNTQRNALLSADGFSLKLSDTDGTLIDAVGNLVGDSAPAWDLPSGKTADGHRISLRRQYENGTRTPRDGRMRASWVSGVRAAAALRTYWGHPQDVGTPGYRSGGPLPVALSAFLPRRTADAVVIKWATQSELDNAGFNLLRSESKTGVFKVINPTLIRGAGTSGERHLYQYTDKSAKPGVVYYYQLEEVSFAGVRATLRTARLRGEVSVEYKLPLIWGDLKKQD